MVEGMKAGAQWLPCGIVGRSVWLINAVVGDWRVCFDAERVALFVVDVSFCWLGVDWGDGIFGYRDGRCRRAEGVCEELKVEMA